MSAGFSAIKHQKIMNAKEQFTDDVMRSLDGAGRAALDQSVKEKILKGMQDAGYRIQDPGCRMQDAGYGTVRVGMIWKIAAVIFLLISLNVFTMVYFSKSSSGRANSAKSVASEYFSYMDPINL